MSSSSSSSPPFSPRDLMLAMAVVVIWGVNFVVMKWGLRSLTPFELGAMRYICAAFPLVLFIKPPKVHWRWVVLFGLLQGVGQFGFLFTALKVGMTASLASVILQTQVFLTAVWTWVLLRGKPARPLIAGMCIAALGLGCLLINELRSNGTGGTTLAGLLLVLCAATSWSCSNVVVRLAQKENASYDPVAFITWGSLMPIIPFIALSAWLDDGDIGKWTQLQTWQQIPLLAWASIAYLGWIATTIGYGLWTQLIQRYSANRVAPFSLCVPVIGLSTGMLMLGEKVTPWQWAGAVLVVLALVVVIWGGRLVEAARRKRL
ncbi:O-acetylserine/cysteine efflux transporter [Comamonas odontotermitis]|uniref:O-acetylserine/cysteine efflux transporter n=1 Tax=Comamonas odontotermitis TaxID=379895 RepID=A0ABR6RAI2_9BURK|nr:EamA family transporter [Comamonas odontotermitis]MBB6576153.1 O-acetylserine/cysteine efflux transporter [Comamonas odontotermitis]